MAIDLSAIFGGVTSQLASGNFLGAAAAGIGGVLGAVGGGGTAGAAKYIGGTVEGRTHGMLIVQAGGKRYFIRTARRSRRHVSRSRGTSMDKMMQLAIMKSLLK